MRRSVLFIVAPLLCFGLTSYVKAQQPPAKSAQLLSPQQAFEILKQVDEKSELVPRRLLDMGMGYAKLNPESCFGLVLPNGKRMVGESKGDNYGMTLKYSGDQYGSYLIGFLYSEDDFSLEGKIIGKGAETLTKGSYAVFVSVEKLMLFGNAVSSQDFAISSKLDEKLLDDKSHKRPRFSLTQEGGNLLLAVEGNKFPIKFK